jgi:hypothetical protein
MAALGGAFGIGFGKVIFGGLGQNVFNPALLGRAFLQAAFPVAITTWPAVRGVDAVTAATPLGLMKFEGEFADVALFSGNTGGSLGETAGVLILLGGAYLAWKGYLNWRIPVSILLTVAALLAAHLHAIDPARYPGPALHALLRRADARRRLHGHRHGDLAGHPRGLDLRHRDRLAGGPDPPLGRAPGGGDVRDPLHERAGPLHQPGDAAARLRHGARADLRRVARRKEAVASMSTRSHPRRPCRPRALERPEVPPWRLVATLAVAGALAGLLIVTVFQWAQPRIQAHQAEVLRAAVGEVLAGPERTERFFLHDGRAHAGAAARPATRCRRARLPGLRRRRRRRSGSR